ncbi:MAG: type I methionyl aminopeptidase [Candidatus Peregrinibacteria bacterium]
MHSSITIKTPEEIAIMRHAGRILKAALDAIEQAIRPGVSTAELDRIANEFILSHDECVPAFRGYRGFPGALCTSVNEEVVHGIPHADHILNEGDIIGIDCGVLYQGFYTDAARTVLVGQVQPEVRHFVKTVKKALDQAIKIVREGAQVGDISAAIEKTIEQQGYSPVAECTGHGVGRDLHEAPEILNVGHKKTGPKLLAGMVLAIEPIANMGRGDVETLQDTWTVVSADGTPSAHFEHTVLVTERGYEILT